MVTDEDLTHLLKQSFDEVTAGVVAAPNLGAQLRRHHRVTRRRMRAAQVALPAAAAASVGWAVASSTHDAPAAPSAHHAGGAATNGRVPATRTVNYVLALPRTSTTFPCLTEGTVRATHETTTWLVGGGTDCTMIVVQRLTTLPAGAAPIELADVPGLYGSSDADSRTVYSRDPSDGTWSGVTVAAGVSDASLARFYVPAG